MSRVLNDRYELVDVLGEGGFGIVWRAHDRLGGASVAVKWMKPSAEPDLGRLRRELTALRVLQLPGVVRLLDHGSADDRSFFVTELVRGRPFPGVSGPLPWSDLRRPLLALLDTVARVHEAGIIHRDLKPANVLVDARGVPTLLDFGLAKGSAGGDTLTATGSVVGTPRYMAPELLLGGKPRVSADLFAIGAMAYEALTGFAPHSDRARGLVASRVREAVTPLRTVAPDVPPAVAEIVLRMLDSDPARRLGDAAQVARALRGADREDHRLPWIGGEQLVDAVLAAIASGAVVRLGGPAGSGRTAVLQRVAERVERPTYALPAGAGPFSAIAPLLSDTTLDALADESLEALSQRLERRLRALATERAVLLADDWERLDRRSRLMLARPPPGLTVVQVIDGPDADVVLEPMAEHRLRELFHGPDRLLHLREDGARALWVRTGGLPRRMAAEVDAWVRAGIAAWEAGRLRISRVELDRLRSGLRVGPAGHERLPGAIAVPDDLDHLLGVMDLCGDQATADVLRLATGLPAWMIEHQLDELLRLGAALNQQGTWRPRIGSRAARAWPQERRRELHARVAAAVDPAAADRWRHLLLAEDAEGAATAALKESHRLAEAGRLGEAVGVLEPVLELARSAGLERCERALLEEWASVAFSTARTAQIERLRYEIGRSTVDVDSLADLVDGALLASNGQGAAALARLETVSAERRELRNWRRALQVAAAQTLPPDAMASVLDEVEASAARESDQESLARVSGWRGLMAYRQGEFERAIELHRQVDPRARRRRSARLSAMLNTASALLDGGHFDDAVGVARAAVDEAAAARLATHEARATWVLRAAAYRRGDDIEVDEELVEAAHALSNDAVAGTVLHAEAAIAWRRREHQRGSELASAAAARYRSGGRPQTAAFARCLALACGAEPATGEAIRLAKALDRTAPDGFRWQAKALWPQLPIEAPPPREDPNRVREVVSPAEVATLASL